MGIVENVLLTGATGYLGRNLLKVLRHNKYNVFVLVRTTSDISAISSLLPVNNIYYVNQEGWQQVFEDHPIDTIIHTAASYGRGATTLTEVVNANLLLPLKLLELGIKYKISNFINTDTALPRGTNDYSLSKKQFLDWLNLYAEKFGLKILNLRVEYFFGPGDDDWKFITFVINKCRSQSPYIDFSEGNQYRDFIYIDDLIEAYLFLLNKIEDFKGLTDISIGSGQAMVLKEIVETIRDLTGASGTELRFGALPTRQNEVMYSRADLSFLKTLGWQPKHSFKEGIIKTLNSKHDRI
jgi:nucleoside-diphosphate-sugar epimerase